MSSYHSMETDVYALLWLSLLKYFEGAVIVK